MHALQTYFTDEGSRTSYDDHEQAAQLLAAVSLQNGSASARVRQAALAAAQRAGVTASQYLRERLLQKASVPTG